MKRAMTDDRRPTARGVLFEPPFYAFAIFQ
jgi:hypothetical protein